MSEVNSEKLESHVLETANRFRLILVDFADENEQTRMEYLCEEVERALKTVLPDQRNEFLKKLMARFPVGSFGPKPLPKGKAAPSAPVIEPDKLKDAEFLVRNLLAIVPTLSGERKEYVVKSLHQAGLTLTPKAQGHYSDESVQRLKAAIQVGDGRGVDADRLMELSILLANFVCKLEPLVWNIWRTLSPRSSIRQSVSMKDVMGRFAFNDPNASQEQIDNELKALQRLIAAIITAVGRVGGQFAKNHLARFSPSEISALVKVERGSVLVSHEVKCWRKYLELAGGLNEDSIETEIRNSIVGYVESLRKGMGL
jgi:hypothetical protein